MERKVSILTWFKVTGIITAGTALFLWVMIATVVGGRIDQLRLQAPGEDTLQLTKGRTYTIFNEYPRTVDSQSTHRPKSLDKIQCTVTTKDTGQTVALTTPDNPRTYGIRKVVGTAVYEFKAPSTGAFTFTATYPPDVEAQPLILIVRQTYAHQTFNAILRGIGVFVLTGIIVVFVVLRDIAKARPQQFPTPAPQG